MTVRTLLLQCLIGCLIFSGAGRAAAKSAEKSAAKAASKKSKGKTKAQGELINRIAAVVNDEIVLQDEVEEASAPLIARLPATLDPQERQRRAQLLRHEVLQTLVADKLLDQQVKLLKIEVTAKEVDKLVEDLRTRNGLTKEQFVQALMAQGMNLEEYRDGMRKQLLKMKIINLKVRSKVKVSDQDVKSLYQKERAAADSDVRVRVRHMVFLVPEGAEPATVQQALEKAQQAESRARSGEDFAELAQKLSEGPSAKNGGDLGFFRRDEMVNAFAKAAFALEKEQISKPVRTPFGWHVIKLIERAHGKVDELNALETQLRERLYQEEVEVAFKRYIEELKSDAFIEIREEKAP